MKKKKDEFYFKNLCVCAECSDEAAQFLMKVLADFDAGQAKKNLDELHDIEQRADIKRHKMMAALNQAFITPIEQEDLVSLSEFLDDITDAVEDVMIEIYMCSIKTIRDDVCPTLTVLQQCINALQAVLEEFKDFKHSKKIDECIIRVNDLEEEGDRLYVKNLRRLYEEDNVSEIIRWRSVYDCLEHCFDLCENAADVVSTVIMKNS